MVSKNAKILITGAGGSIGSGLVEKLKELEFENLILLDHSEYLLFQVYHKNQYKFKSFLCDIRDKERLEEIFTITKPEIVFHTAALKHVPLLEENPKEAIKTNVLGTLNLVELSHKFSVKKFIFISSDKAVKPTSIMGSTKRIGEMICQYFQKRSSTIYTAVRFGNVLGSSGSVIPIFKEQIEKGGPITLTSKEITRFFMSIEQACELLVKTMDLSSKEDDIFFLNMGEPIRIYDLAKYMILSYGKMPEKDIKIQIIGLRPGEKLHEEIFYDGEYTINTAVEGIRKVIMNGLPENFYPMLLELIQEKDASKIKNLIQKFVPEYSLS
ncbi:MAG: polysaccharide biosynthesis protein [Leptonema sp. (in: bacteria)]